MKIIKRKAECVSVMMHQGERLYGYRCPKCGLGVSEDYRCCPYCCQRLKFVPPSTEDLRKYNVEMSYKDCKFKLHS